MNNYQEPFTLFSNWINEAQNNLQIIEPTAMNLCTVNSQNKPSSRMILLKKFDDRGFCFFTNLNSRKALELENNQNVALCFHWAILGKQIRIEGEVEKVTEKEADEYFASRRRGSQIGAWASKQSKEMLNQQEFDNHIKQIEQNFINQEVSRPPFWSGFRVKPEMIEFWQEGEFRLHQRIVYQKKQEAENLFWNVVRLYP